MRTFIYSLAICLIFIGKSAAATLVRDTTVKMPFPMFGKSTQLSSYESYFPLAMEYLKKDSLDKGINLFYNGMKALNAEKNILRVSPYHINEVYSFSELYIKGRLNSKEKELCELVFKLMFTTDNVSDMEKRADNILKKPEGSVFISRVNSSTA